jgi:pimeloyl-ACP methyl ester carboxylesterase
MINQDFKLSSKKLFRSFENKGIGLRVHHIPYLNDSIRFIEAGLEDESKPLLVFIHGAPGGCDAFNNFLQDKKFVQKYRLVSVDRLGYGYSHFGEAEISVKKQAEMIGFVMDQFNHQEVYLIGHSFGGPVAMSASLERAEIVKGIVLLSAALDPTLEKMFWFSSIPIRPVFRSIFSKSFKVSSYEKISHQAALSDVVDQWINISVPILHIHGDKDRLVSVENVEFTKRLPTKTTKIIKILEGAGHLIPWTRAKDLKILITEFIDVLITAEEN